MNFKLGTCQKKRQKLVADRILFVLRIWGFKKLWIQFLVLWFLLQTASFKIEAGQASTWQLTRTKTTAHCVCSDALKRTRLVGVIGTSGYQLRITLGYSGTGRFSVLLGRILRQFFLVFWSKELFWYFTFIIIINIWSGTNSYSKKNL